MPAHSPALLVAMPPPTLHSPMSANTARKYTTRAPDRLCFLPVCLVFYIHTYMRRSGVLDTGGPSAWEGATAALRRSVGFLEASASGSTFDTFGHDYVLCLDGIARRLPSEGPSAALGVQARAAARRLGERWLGRYLELPTDEDAGSLRDRLFGLFALRRVGLSGPRLDRAEASLRAQLEPAGAAIAALLPFDPATEPPPEDAHPLPAATRSRRTRTTASPRGSSRSPPRTPPRRSRSRSRRRAWRTCCSGPAG